MSLAAGWAQRLRAERGCGPVPVVEAERCLRRHASPVPCGACAEVCPAAAVVAAPTAVGVGDGCIGCEACVTACPTGALAPPPEIVRQRRERLDRGGEVVRFTCVRQPGRSGATATFGCLAGLPLTILLAPLTRPACRVEVERGGCRGCTLAATGSRLDATLRQARALLAAFGVEPDRIYEVERLPREAGAPGEVVGRRELLLRLRAGARRAVATLREEKQEEARGEAAGAAAPCLAAVLRGLGTPVASATLPSGLHAGVVTATTACFGCNVCETLCPTRALRREVEGETIRLCFTPARCTGCGACVEVCLAGALTFTSATGEGGPLSLSAAYLGGAEVTLVEVAPRACARCGVTFTGLPGDLCETCLTTGRGADRLRGFTALGTPPLPRGSPSTPGFGEGRLN